MVIFGFRSIAAAIVVGTVAVALAAEPTPPANSPTIASGQQFDAHVAPLLARRCLECHNPSDKKGGLDLTGGESAAAGGESGPVLVAGKPDESLLWQHVSNDEMPPKKPLPQPERELLKSWIAGGAKWGTSPINRFRYSTDVRAGYDWWSLKPIAPPQPPQVKHADWPRSPLDQFVLARLEAKQLAPSPPADTRTLLRRLYFDIVGLPPSPEQAAEFLADDSPDAYERLVDRLLESPHYGERWARHWLDVIRFGESQGFEYDRLRPGAYRYRDWVVTALNDDLPYDEFVKLQIAGDSLRPYDPTAIIATGFLVAGPWDEPGQKQQSAAMRAVVRQDELEDLVAVTAQTFLGLTANCARCHDHKFDPISQAEYYQLAASLSGVRHGERPGLAGQPVYAVVPQQPDSTHLLARGNPAQPRDVVSPAGLAATGVGSADFHLPADAPEAQRRVKLAEWIADRANPLAARVIANRLWHYHFGVGLVDTPNDFGFGGSRPSHPELLDWLAAELQRGGWRLKQLQRTIVLSATYRQASRYHADSAAIDADNRLVWRKNPLRLQAEIVRDAVLAVAGQLNPRVGGPSYQDFKLGAYGGNPVYDPIDPVGVDEQRRSLYRTWVRGGTNRLLDVFDCPDPSTATPRRMVTTTPLQALATLNNSLVLRMADHFAERLRREAGDEISRQIDLAWRIAFARSAQANEAADAAELVKHHGLPALCRVLLNSNEFLFID